MCGGGRCEWSASAAATDGRMCCQHCWHGRTCSAMRLVGEICPLSVPASSSVFITLTREWSFRDSATRSKFRACMALWSLCRALNCPNTAVSGTGRPGVVERRVPRAAAPQRQRRGRGWLHRAERPARGARGAGGGREGPRDTWALHYFARVKAEH